MSNVHIVLKNDTLTKISKLHGVSIKELQTINHLPNPNKLDIGQSIMLKKEQVLGFQALMLDADRNPINGLEYQFEFAGRIIKGVTELGGLTKKIMTDSPQDQVRILVKRLDNSLKEVAAVASGYGNKLVTLISPSIKVEAKTEKHPDVKPGQLPNRYEKPAPIHDPKTKKTPTSNKKDLGPKVTPTKTPDGKPLTKVEGDIPELDFLDEYNGEVMTDADYAWAAKELGVEEAAIKAYAVVESGGGGFFVMHNKKVPKLLYERHYFSRRTGHKYSAKYPDVSLPTGYYVPNGKYIYADDSYKQRHGVPTDVEYYRQATRKEIKEKKEGLVTLKDLLAEGKATAAKDKYVWEVANYKRLSKAYQLNSDAALESCSWGAFQIMGSHWKAMGYSSISAFVKAMSRSEKEQIKAFVLYIKKISPQIIKALNQKNWAEAARLYNGASYKQNKYDLLLEKHYKKFKDE